MRDMTKHEPTLSQRLSRRIHLGARVAGPAAYLVVLASIAAVGGARFYWAMASVFIVD